MLNPHRLLVAEEDDNCRTFLADNLTADGYAVDVAASREEALAHLRERSVDLIVVDVNGKTLALLDTLRAEDGPVGATPSDVAMIVLTKHPEQLHRVRLLERGADDVVAKPFGYGELRARSPRSCAVSLRAGPSRRSLPATCASTYTSARSPCTANRSASALPSTGCCAPSAPSPRAYSPALSSCVPSGAMRPPPGPGRWTATPTGCAPSWPALSTQW